MKVAIQNFSQSLSDADLAAYVAAYQIQVNRDFGPALGLRPVNLKILPNDQAVSPGEWMLGFFETADMAGALGYHDVTANGDPLGKIFVKTTLDDGAKVSVTGSHELLEMMGDPLIASMVQIDNKTAYALELCDAPEDDQFGYDINGVTVSDFVLMDWFTGGPGPFDFKGHIQQAQEILPGGYIGALTFTNGKWSQIQNGDRFSSHYRALPGSRFERRTRNRSQFIKSVR